MRGLPPVILTKRATRADGKISDSFAYAKPVPVSEIAEALQALLIKTQFSIILILDLTILIFRSIFNPQ